MSSRSRSSVLALSSRFKHALGATCVVLAGCSTAVAVTPEPEAQPDSSSHTDAEREASSAIACFARADAGGSAGVLQPMDGPRVAGLSCADSDGGCTLTENAPRLNAIDVSFPCDCDPSAGSDVMVRLDVTDADTPIDQLTSLVGIMNCGDFEIAGTEFAGFCAHPLTGSETWSIQLADPQHNRVRAMFNAPIACSSMRYPCHLSRTHTIGSETNYDCVPP